MALICVGVGGFLSLFVFHLTVRVNEEDSEKHPTEKVRSKCQNIFGQNLNQYLFTQIKGRKRFSGFNHQEELQGLVHNPTFLQVGGDLDGYNGFYQHVSSLHALVYPNNTQVFRNFLVSYRLSKNTILPQSFF